MLKTSPWKQSMATSEVYKNSHNKIKFKFPVKYMPTFFDDKGLLQIYIRPNYT